MTWSKMFKSSKRFTTFLTLYLFLRIHSRFEGVASLSQCFAQPDLSEVIVVSAGFERLGNNFFATLGGFEKLLII